MKPYLIIYEDIIEEVIKHCDMNNQIEVGGYLYGNIVNKKNICKVYVDGYYYEPNRKGKSSEYTFSLLYEISAIKFGYKINKNLIGCYHSHGQYNAIFSETDKNILEKHWASNKIVMVYSPSYNKIICDFVTNKKSIPMKILVITNKKEVVTFDKYIKRKNKCKIKKK